MAKDVVDMAKGAMRSGRLALSLVFACREKGAKAHKTPFHKHPSWQCDMLLDVGAVFIDGTGRETVLNPGDAILIPPGRRHAFAYRKDGASWLAFWFSLKGVSPDIEPLRIRAGVFSRSVISSLELLHELEDVSPARRLTASSSLLAGFMEASLPGDEPMRPVCEGLPGRALLWIERREGRRADVKELCEAVGCSPSHLSHAFKKEFGESLKEFIDRRRAETLERLIRQTDLSPSKLASMLGFRDSCELSRFCRRRLGSSPQKLGR